MTYILPACRAGRYSPGEPTAAHYPGERAAISARPGPARRWLLRVEATSPSRSTCSLGKALFIASIGDPLLARSLWGRY
jgi:hypothetical protein